MDLKLTSRARWLIGVGAALAWAVTRATDGRIVNTGGWPTFAEFWATIIRPDVSIDFLQTTADAAVTTLALAILGTAVALLIGIVSAPILSERVGAPVPRAVLRTILTVPRAVHEILWALLLTQVFGFDAWVGIIAIGLPFGAITAKVFAETIDEADASPFTRLRSVGASRLGALAYGIVPAIKGELLSFGFYRLECAIRSAAVLGVIGVGGLGFQLDLSFESLRYDEIWTLIAALMLLSGSADWLSTRIRRRRRVVSRRVALVSTLAVLAGAWTWLAPSAGLLWAERTRRRASDLFADLFWPRLGPDGWGELTEATVDTVAMSIIALAVAGTVGLVVATRAARPISRQAVAVPVASQLLGWSLRGVLLLWRAVPAPIWAFLFVLVMFPGPWPGAVALGVYNAGVLGRLFAEVFEERDPAPSDRLHALGAAGLARLAYGTLPAAAGRLISIALYRWEVIVRETVVVGVVGAGGLGQLINEHRAARDFAAVFGAIIAMVVLAAVIDALSATARRALRRRTM